MPQQIEVPGMGVVEFPDGMSDADIAKAIQRSMPQQQKAIDPTEGMSGAQKFLAGAGKAFYDVGRGAGAIVTDAIPAAAKLGLSTRKDVDESKLRDAALMNTGAGTAGNIVGNIAAFAPSALIPGANTVAGGAAIGALAGALQPVGTDDSRSTNAAMGGAFGAVVPSGIRLAKGLRAAFVDPFTEAGRSKIAGSLLNRSAADPAAVAERLRTAQGSTPGFLPTAGQAADDAGVAALERTMRAVDPKGFDAIDKSQRGALVNALRSVAQTPEAKAAQLEKVEKTARSLYGKALKENVEVTPELVKLASRPSMRRAEARAIDLAAEQSSPFQARLADMKPQYLPIEAPPVAPSSVIDKPATDSLGMLKQAKEISIPAQPKPASPYFELPPVDSVPVRDMHTLKMGMDALMADPTLGIAGREAKAINRTRNQLLDLLPESYQTARKAHIELNKPVHQMDIGSELYKRFTPALADQGGLPFKSTAESFAKALREGDELAKNVTGMKNAKLAEIMTPEQMRLLEGVAKDSATKAAAENIGRGVGSDTIQKVSMSNIAAEAGVPNWLSSIARVPGGWAKRAGDVLYASADEQIRARLADLLRNPQGAAQAMQAAGATPSAIANFLKQGAQGGMFSLPAIMNAQQ